MKSCSESASAASSLYLNTSHCNNNNLNFPRPGIRIHMFEFEMTRIRPGFTSDYSGICFGLRASSLEEKSVVEFKLILTPIC